MPPGPPSTGRAAADLFGRQLEVLQAAAARLSRADGREAVGRAVVEETGRIIDYHNARVYVLEAPDQLVPIAFEGRVGAYAEVDFDLLRTTLGFGFTGWVGLHGEPLLVPDANVDPRGASIPGTDDVDESMLVVPMRYDDVVVGVITLSKLGLNQFDRHDLRLLSILADLAATALESARNLARSGALAGELRLLLDVSGELAASLDTRQVANVLARHLATRHGRRRVRDLVVGSGQRSRRQPRLPPDRRAGHARALLRHRGVPADPAGPRRPDRRPASTPRRPDADPAEAALLQRRAIARS